MGLGTLSRGSTAGARREREPFRLFGQRGFTLIETLVVVAVLSFTAGLTLPKALDQARDKRAKADLRTITVALSLYYQEHETYPLYLQELTDADLIMSDFSYRNSSGRYYFYAVHYDLTEGGSRLDHYVLGDPKGNPAVRYDTKDWGEVIAALAPGSPGLPEGRDPGGYTSVSGYRPRAYIYGDHDGFPGPVKITFDNGDVSYEGVDVVWLQKAQPANPELLRD